MNDILRVLCEHSVDIWNGGIPISSTVVSRCTGLPIGKVKYRLKKLKQQGFIIADSYGNSTEDGMPFCIHGYIITEKAKHTEEYKRAWAKERQQCKDILDIDIGEVDVAIDSPVYLGTRPQGNSTVVLYRCSVCDAEFYVASGAQLYCDHCGTEFDMKARELDD